LKSSRIEQSTRQIIKKKLTQIINIKVQSQVLNYADGADDQ